MLPIVHHPAYHASLPEHHRFPMGKFRALMDFLKESGLAKKGNTYQPLPAPENWLNLAHNPRYVEQILAQNVPKPIEREIGLPVTKDVALRAQAATGGTVLAARLALENGLAANTAGGSHHARYAHGAGFCVFNDVAVAIKVLQAEGLINKALVIDLDVHQGDGTADIFKDDDSVFTFSLHAEKNYPVRKIPSTLDIAVKDGLQDEAYFTLLKQTIPALLAREMPDILFYNAGIDPHADDRLGKLSLSDHGLRDRDAFILSEALNNDIPTACVIGGGYHKDIPTLARRHAIIHQQAHTLLMNGQKA